MKIPTPKEKALQLFHEYYFEISQVNSDISEEILVSVLSIKLAIIGVDEILKLLVSQGVTRVDKNYKYWIRVKRELQKL
jgi:hypothetical protein